MTKMKGIIFSTPMVQRVLNGTKTMTRRLVKPQPNLKGRYWRCDGIWGTDDGGDGQFYIEEICSDREPSERYAVIDKPAYQVGDICYVKETWNVLDKPNGTQEYLYRAQENVTGAIIKDSIAVTVCKWKTSLFMPRAAARTFLRIEEVGIERLQDITEEDAKAEGFTKSGKSCAYLDVFLRKGDAQCIWVCESKCFVNYWDHLYRKDTKKQWNVNPWVFKYRFKVLTKEELQEVGNE